MESLFKFFKLFSVVFIIYFVGNESSRVDESAHGHSLFFEGILVAMKISLSDSFAASPKIFSLCPSPYANAVSKKFIPSSIALRKTFFDSLSFAPIHSDLPIPQLPKPRMETG